MTHGNGKACYPLEPTIPWSSCTNPLAIYQFRCFDQSFSRYLLVVANRLELVADFRLSNCSTRHTGILVVPIRLLHDARVTVVVTIISPAVATTIAITSLLKGVIGCLRSWDCHCDLHSKWKHSCQDVDWGLHC